ncbi:MAG TPA: tRNA (N6-isopentenyl adenosine(37)-C2)-methylthiotransferase MiaB [Thermoanaerobaculaceae bacterium]|nr:tRNA (N6-isopentenyl adenosine(37)-C2)-methylthiotransferase MiaB [Thermoanaerobaculaceae bacterium]HRS16750.1 tRNA (N6-isopentenyl adenosine(37)-C2)-methylthiotransferase MiaB [Thermoanaerobaculaceae bacterium]
MGVLGSYFVETWGCQMNVLDSQRLEGVLQARGLAPAPRAEEADVVLLNTCAVREKSVQKVVSRLGELRRWREERGLPRVVGLCGCVAEQEGDRFLERLPVVGFILGPGRIEDLGLALDAWEDGERDRRTGFDAASYDPATIARPASARQYVTIIHGCNQRCTYCVVPRTRGREVSRPLEDIAGEVKELVARGAKEITLLGQTVNAYRCPRTGATLAELLRELGAIELLWNLQFITSHPRFFTPALVRAVAETAVVGSYLHMPFQAGSDRVLRRMARGYTRRRYLDVIDRLRTARGDLNLSTDVIVGFPGETEADFEETLALVEQVRFGQLYGFVYSPRRGTAAAELGEPVPRGVTKARISKLFAVQTEIQLALNRALVGSVVELLVDGPAKRGTALWQGRGRDNRVVNFPAWEGIAPGQLALVEVTGASAHSLVGRRAGASGERRRKTARA